MNRSEFTRRDWLIAAGAATAGLGSWSRFTTAQDAARPSAPRQRALRVAHLSDIHVQPERLAEQGMLACLRHVHSLPDTPGLIITGGDCVMDSFGSDDARTTLQWQIWNRVLSQEASIPVRSCIGNHDVWGWAKSSSKTTGDEPNWGKKRAIEMLHLDDRYYTFGQAGWQFIVLDSTHPLADGSEGYTACLDEAQFDWLTRTLRDLPSTTPVLVVSHIPILSATALVWSKNEQGDFRVDGSLLHTDCLKLKELFGRHPNVRLCISGHMHLVDRVDYNGVTYLCNGAVCGNWWKGRHRDCDEGYGLLDLYSDGSWDHQYVKYGWKAEAAS